MPATLTSESAREVILAAKEFVWRKRLGNYSVREIAPMLSEHLGRPVSHATVGRWIKQMNDQVIDRTTAMVEQRRAIELEKLDEDERIVQVILDRAMADPGAEPDERVLRAVTTKLKIRERRARYTGADAPTQVTGDLTVHYRLVSDGQVDDGALT